VPLQTITSALGKSVAVAIAPVPPEEGQIPTPLMLKLVVVAGEIGQVRFQAAGKRPARVT
jgi:hypothetical protein